MNFDFGRMVKKYWPLIPALVAFAYLVNHLDLVQDDAYISYRYVANFLNGHGLVFNIGERIEGFTNFSWEILLILIGVLGGDYLSLSRFIGFLFGAGTIVICFKIAQVIFAERDKWFGVLAVYLMGINLSLAYWSAAGLETAMFSFFAMLAVYWYLQRSYLLIWALVMVVWTRPDGAVVTAAIILAEAISERRLPKFSLISAAVAFVASIPYVIFKELYYGGILPNPFYAKTGLTMKKLMFGLDYVWEFLQHYSFYGVGLAFVIVVFAIYYRRMKSREKTLLIFFGIYTLYILLIGGDVLKVDRFFLPLFGIHAILIMIALHMLIKNLARKSQLLILFVTALVLFPLTYYSPLNTVETFRFNERMFMKKMRSIAINMRESDSTDFTVAVPTIGIFGYELLGHHIIDMVGLTDSTIARHSEEPIPGMETTWKETKHNSYYILKSAPDYILFSTGKKPSAPAERALHLYPQFMNSYRTIGWFYRAFESQPQGVINPVFKKMHPIEGEIKPTYPVAYVQYYKDGLDQYVYGHNREAIAYFDSAMAVSPKPYYIYLLYQKAFCEMSLNRHLEAIQMLNQVIARDSAVFEAQRDLYLYSRLLGNEREAAIHARWVQKLTPWYWPKVKADTDRQVLRNRRVLPPTGQPPG